jgi:hypothetical protein
VSSAERSVRRLKLRTDRAISQVYARLAGDSCARAAFSELLHEVRVKAPLLLHAPPHAGGHPGVEAVANLACHRRDRLRPVKRWSGWSGSWRGAVNALAQHLVGSYPVPAFLSSAWYATDPYAVAKRHWFIAHAAGARFRSLSLPICLTSRMEHIFLSSPDHFGIEYAMRRAELVALGADLALVDAVLAAAPAAAFDHSDFWRTVWLFLIANSASIEVAQVGPIIDFLHAIRHQRVAVDTGAGIVMRDPPQPGFSMKGRTVRSVLRLMEQWHQSLGLTAGGLSWRPSAFRPMVLEMHPDDPDSPPVFWEMRELTTTAQLRAEGVALQHCVASYSYSCWRGAWRIWSLRRRRDLNVRSILTVQVDPARRTIVQARGMRNRRATGKPLQLVQTWAARERLRLASL